jgi:hypothetical protein
VRSIIAWSEMGRAEQSDLALAVVTMTWTTSRRSTRFGEQADVVLTECALVLNSRT